MKLRKVLSSWRLWPFWTVSLCSLLLTLLVSVFVLPVAYAQLSGQRLPHPTVRAPAPAAPLDPQLPRPPLPSTTTAEAIPADHVVETARAFGNLAIFPITSQKQVDVGPVISLAEAQRRGHVEVREVRPRGSNSRFNENTGVVGSLEIQNRGTVPIFVLAGTVVKGGKQDRQIGQDFVIEGGKTAAVDAFCVEPHRWTPQRNGVQTGGRFQTSGSIATSSVRVAGQYQKNQGDVWAKVGATNAVHRKNSGSGTLTATLDDESIIRQKTPLTNEVNAFLAARTPATIVVGFAYAVDGKVVSARWFANHAIWKLNAPHLVDAAVLDALTARAQATMAGQSIFSGAPPSASDVDTFVQAALRAPLKEERTTDAANVNQYRETPAAFGSSTMLKPSAATGGVPRKISSDVSKK